MDVIVHKSHEQLSLAAAEEILSLVTSKHNAVLCLAGGETPKLTYQLVVRLSTERQIDFSNVHIIGLDEWVGIPPYNSGSCHFFLKEHLLIPLKIKVEHTHLFNSLAKDTTEECTKMEHCIAGVRGIDLMVVGIGMNGHIGFNEPGISFNLSSHVAKLDNVTQTVGQKYFTKKETLQEGITLGLKNLRQSKHVILIASGVKKSDIIKKTLEEEVTNSIPASILRTHPNSSIHLDIDAASKLTNQSRGFS